MTFTDKEMVLIEDAIERGWGSFRQFGQPGLSAQMVLDELRTAGFVIERDWRPIAEAPKEATKLLVWEPDLGVGIGHTFRGGLWASMSGQAAGPTHFRPLPAPPKEGT